MKEILSHLLADAEARSLVSDSFPKMHINNKINVSVKVSVPDFNYSSRRLNGSYLDYYYECNNLASRDYAATLFLPG